MLVIVEYRDISDFLQSVFNLIAFRRRNILQIDTCIVRLQNFYRADKFVRILGAQAYRHSVNITEGFEQSSLALHNRHSCLRTDIAQTKYARTVADNCYHVATAGIFKG